MPDRLTPSEKSLRGRIAAHESWSRTPDRAARTANARRALLDRFEKQVDPDGVLPVAERQRRADHARKAHFSRLALRSASSRRKAAELKATVDARAAELNAEAAAAEAELAELGGDAA